MPQQSIKTGNSGKQKNTETCTQSPKKETPTYMEFIVSLSRKGNLEGRYELVNIIYKKQLPTPNDYFFEISLSNSNSFLQGTSVPNCC